MVRIKGKSYVACTRCKHLKDNYCKALKHVLANGYAMDFHSNYCGIKKGDLE